MNRALIRTLILSVIFGGCASGPSPEQKELARINRQLDELYKPLAGLVEESRLSVQDFLKKEGRTQILPSDREPTEAELKRWIEKAETDLMPRNDKMCALIRAHADLIDGPEMPKSWTALLEHEDGWKAAHEKWRKDGTPYPFHAPTPFPRLLEKELKESIVKLEARRYALHKNA